MAENKSLELVTREEIGSLFRQEADPGVSIYLPTARVAVEPEENALVLKNVLHEANERLKAHGLRRSQIDELLDPFIELLGDTTFWVHQLEGLALFRAAGFFRYYRLPFRVPQRVVVGRRFHIKPLMPALSGNGRFYVLLFSQHSVRLFHASKWGIEEMDLDGAGIPRSLDDALRFDDLQKPDMSQSHQAPKAAGGMFHGHGPGAQDNKRHLLRYAKSIDDGLIRLLPDDQPPLVLVGVDYLHAIYREASHYRNILKEGIDGNYDHLSAHQLHDKVGPLLERHLDSEVERARERYLMQEPKGLASCELDDVLVAATSGRVGWLFVRSDDERWGRYEPTEGTLEIHETPEPGDDDLLDLAARQTFVADGRVYVVPDEEMPCDAPLAGAYRF